MGLFRVGSHLDKRGESTLQLVQSHGQWRTRRNEGERLNLGRALDRSLDAWGKPSFGFSIPVSQLMTVTRCGTFTGIRVVSLASTGTYMSNPLPRRAPGVDL